MTLDKGKNNVKMDRFQVKKKLFFYIRAFYWKYWVLLSKVKLKQISKVYKRATFKDFEIVKLSLDEQIFESRFFV